MKRKYQNKLAKLAKEALDSIFNYNGIKVINLPTGERAIDFDDSYIIIKSIGYTEPVFRWKKEQWSLNNGKKEKAEYDARLSELPIDEICKIADNL